MKKAAFRLQPVLELRRTQERAAAVASARAAAAAADAQPVGVWAIGGAKRVWIWLMRACTAVSPSTGPPPRSSPGRHGR